jgi:NAD(P)-dependent dehydrogenase (short-subunit alcohol dehydrogenase family)
VAARAGCFDGGQALMPARWILVTGASRGIGRAAALELAARGAGIGLNYLRNDAAAAATAAEIEKRGGTCVLLPANIAKADERETLVSRFAAAGGRIDGLVHAAALGAPAPALTARPNRFALAWETHALAFVDLARLAHPFLARGAALVALSSLGAHRVLPGYAPIAAAKAALEAIVRYLAIELAGSDVNVNAVCGGPVDTESLRSFPAFADIERESALRPPWRLGRPEDLAPVIAWLLGPEARWVRGQVIVADGGFSLV